MWTIALQGVALSLVASHLNAYLLWSLRWCVLLNYKNELLTWWEKHMVTNYFLLVWVFFPFSFSPASLGPKEYGSKLASLTAKAEHILQLPELQETAVYKHRTRQFLSECAPGHCWPSSQLHPSPCCAISLWAISCRTPPAMGQMLGSPKPV